MLAACAHANVFTFGDAQASAFYLSWVKQYCYHTRVFVIGSKYMGIRLNRKCLDKHENNLGQLLIFPGPMLLRNFGENLLTLIKILMMLAPESNLVNFFTVVTDKCMKAQLYSTGLTHKHYSGLVKACLWQALSYNELVSKICQNVCNIGPGSSVARLMKFYKICTWVSICFSVMVVSVAKVLS
jgi:hypothetical protein